MRIQNRSRLDLGEDRQCAALVECAWGRLLAPSQPVWISLWTGRQGRAGPLPGPTAHGIASAFSSCPEAQGFQTESTCWASEPVGQQFSLDLAGQFWSGVSLTCLTVSWSGQDSWAMRVHSKLGLVPLAMPKAGLKTRQSVSGH